MVLGSAVLSVMVAPCLLVLIEKPIEQRAVAGAQLQQLVIARLLFRREQSLSAPLPELVQAILADRPLDDEVEPIVILPLAPFPGHFGDGLPLATEVIEIAVDPRRLIRLRCYLSHNASWGMLA